LNNRRRSQIGGAAFDLEVPMADGTAVKCEFCKRNDRPENMVGVMLLVRGQEESGHYAHRDCHDRYRTEVARSMYKYRAPADKRKSFEQWRQDNGY
jgi:hypothetical protein